METVKKENPTGSPQALSLLWFYNKYAMKITGNSMCYDDGFKYESWDQIRLCHDGEMPEPESVTEDQLFIALKYASEYMVEKNRANQVATDDQIREVISLMKEFPLPL